MKYGVDAASIERGEHARALGGALEQDVIDMPVVLAVGRNDRAAQHAALLERGKHIVIAAPDREPVGRDPFGLLQLGPQERRRDLARQERGSDVLPGIFVDLAAKEPAAVGAFLAHDLGGLDQFAIVDEQAAALAGNSVLGFLQAEAADIADGAEWPTL